MPEDYEVGYKKPPKHSQFRKGRSGNPKGRPKGAKNLMTELLEELQEQIPIREGRVQKQVSKQRAMLKSLTAKAVKGDTKAASLVIGMIYRLFHDDETDKVDIDLSAEDQAILETFKVRTFGTEPPKGPPEAIATQDEAREPGPPDA